MRTKWAPHVPVSPSWANFPDWGHFFHCPLRTDICSCEIVGINFHTDGCCMHSMHSQRALLFGWLSTSGTTMCESLFHGRRQGVNAFQWRCFHSREMLVLTFIQKSHQGGMNSPGSVAMRIVPLLVKIIWFIYTPSDITNHSYSWVLKVRTLTETAKLTTLRTYLLIRSIFLFESSSQKRWKIENLDTRNQRLLLVF